MYITANPHAYILNNQTFHDLITLNEHHDPDLGAVSPDSVVNISSRAAQQYPHKRLIVHFMQPHHPFINHEGLLIDERGWEFNGNDQKEGRLWKLIKGGYIKKQDAWDAYQQSLEYVLEHVADLLESLDGKTIITSDHGNMFGERLSPIPQRIYAHPKGIFMNELVKVPWFIPGFNRR